jgi:hypothetical protein
MTLASVSMILPLQNGHRAGRVTASPNCELDMTHAGCFLSQRLFKSEQPSLVGFPTIDRLKSTSAIQRDAPGMKRLAILGNDLPRQCGIARLDRNGTAA